MNSFDNFSILFVGDSLHIGNRIFPMGAMATEILNWDRVPLRELRTRAEEFDSAICAVLKSRDRELRICIHKGQGTVIRWDHGRKRPKVVPERLDR